MIAEDLKTQNTGSLQVLFLEHGTLHSAAVSVPATVPDAIVDIAGLPLEVTLVKGWNSSPSLAMANRTRGIGNMAPRRLEGQEQLPFSFFVP